MHQKYAGKWFNTVAFEEDAVFYEHGKQVKKQVWYEAAKIPGRLIIKYDSLQSGNGLFFSNDSLYVFRNDTLLSKKRRLHNLLILSLDVYVQPAEKTISGLLELGYNLDKIYTDTWQGKAVYVVGANKGDTISTQCWIDKENMLFLRMIGTDKGKRKEVIFNNYKPLGSGWMEQEVIFKFSNDIYMKENYYNVRIPSSISDYIFSTINFKTKSW